MQASGSTRSESSRHNTHAAAGRQRQPPVRSRPAVRRVAYIAIRTRLGRRLTSSSGEEALFETRPMSGSRGRANYVSRPESRHRSGVPPGKHPCLHEPCSLKGARAPMQAEDGDAFNHTNRNCVLTACFEVYFTTNSHLITFSLLVSIVL